MPAPSSTTTLAADGAVRSRTIWALPIASFPAASRSRTWTVCRPSIAGNDHASCGSASGCQTEPAKSPRLLTSACSAPIASIVSVTAVSRVTVAPPSIAKFVSDGGIGSNSTSTIVGAETLPAASRSTSSTRLLPGGAGSVIGSAGEKATNGPLVATPEATSTTVTCASNASSTPGSAVIDNVPSAVGSAAPSIIDIAAMSGGAVSSVTLSASGTDSLPAASRNFP